MFVFEYLIVKDSTTEIYEIVVFPVTKLSDAKYAKENEAIDACTRNRIQIHRCDNVTAISSYA